MSVRLLVYLLKYATVVVHKNSRILVYNTIPHSVLASIPVCMFNSMLMFKCDSMHIIQTVI